MDLILIFLLLLVLSFVPLQENILPTTFSSSSSLFRKNPHLNSLLSFSLASQLLLTSVVVHVPRRSCHSLSFWEISICVGQNPTMQHAEEKGTAPAPIKKRVPRAESFENSPSTIRYRGNYGMRRRKLRWHFSDPSLIVIWPWWIPSTMAVRIIRNFNCDNGGECTWRLRRRARTEKDAHWMRDVEKRSKERTDSRNRLAKELTKTTLI